MKLYTFVSTKNNLQTLYIYILLRNKKLNFNYILIY